MTYDKRLRSYFPSQSFERMKLAALGLLIHQPKRFVHFEFDRLIDLTVQRKYYLIINLFYVMQVLSFY